MPSYLTTLDVATQLGVSLDTVRRWLRSGELKGTPFGRAGYRIEDTDFQAFLNQRRRQSLGIAVEGRRIQAAWIRAGKIVRREQSRVFDVQHRVGSGI